jgi:hypothetical protein
MVTQGWKSMPEVQRRSGGRIRIVSDPIEHQGVRNALRDSFDCGKDMPAEFEQLLHKIR